MFLLPNGDAAGYRWGTLLIRLSNYTPLNAKTLPKTLAGLTQQMSHWNTNAEFRSAISIQHEVVHLLQDVLTGIGHLDHLTRQEHLPELLARYRFLGYMPDETMPFNSEHHRHIRDAMYEDLIVLPMSLVPTARQTDIEERASALVAGHISSTGPENGMPSMSQVTSVISLLEAEAASTVASRFYHMKMNKTQAEIAFQNQSLFIPYYMDSDYNATRTFLTGSVMSTFGLSDKDDDSMLGIGELVDRLVVFLVDLACAHPSRSLIETLDLDIVDYHPSVKFIRLVRDFLNMDESQTESFLHAMLQHQVVEAERILLGISSQSYISSEQIYTNWMELFGSKIQDNDNHILRIRHLTSKLRLEKPASCVFKALERLVETQVPIICMTPPGFRSFYSDPHYLLDENEFRNLIIDLTNDDLILSLLNYFGETGVYICPKAESKICGAAVAECLQGIRNNQFPNTSSCWARAFLEKNGFNITSS